MKAPEPGIPAMGCGRVIYIYRVDEGGVYRNIRRVLPGVAITVTVLQNRRATGGTKSNGLARAAFFAANLRLFFTGKS
jgi:hypothetical protein